MRISRPESQRKPIIWERLRRDAKKCLHDVGVLADGTLQNPNGYPESKVRTAVAAAAARLHDRAKAVKTRAERKRHHVWEHAQFIVECEQTGPADHCYLCGSRLDHPDSLRRSSGPPAGSSCPGRSKK